MPPRVEVRDFVSRRFQLLLQIGNLRARFRIKIRRAIGHDNMLALTHNSEAELLKRSNGPEMINAGNLRHPLNRDFDLANIRSRESFFDGGQIFADRIANIF